MITFQMISSTYRHNGTVCPPHNCLSCPQVFAGVIRNHYKNRGITPQVARTTFLQNQVKIYVTILSVDAYQCSALAEIVLLFIDSVHLADINTQHITFNGPGSTNSSCAVAQVRAAYEEFIPVRFAQPCKQLQELLSRRSSLTILIFGCTLVLGRKRLMTLATYSKSPWLGQPQTHACSCSVHTQSVV